MTDNILLVGGDDQSCRPVAEALSRRGYRVTASADGARAQRQLAAAPPDLIERWVREYPVLCREAGIETALQTLHLGGTEFLVKPVDAEELVSAVRRIFCRATG